MKITKATAVALGKKGGSARSPRKAVAAVQNGKRGGRPKTITPTMGTSNIVKDLKIEGVYEIPGLHPDVVAQMRRDAEHSILLRFERLGP